MFALRLPARTIRTLRLRVTLALTSLTLVALAAGSVAAADLPWSTNTADGVWSTTSSVGPGPEESVAGIYDAARSRLILFGGWNGAALNTSWTLSFAGSPQWAPLTTAGPVPSPRYAHSMVYDSARDRVLVFGGSGDGYAFSRYNDVWSLNLSGTPTWTLLTPAGTPPSGRLGHMAIYDPVGDRMIVFGGYDGSFRNDLWQLSLSGTPTWSPIVAGGTLPGTRDFGTVIYDPTQHRMVLFGGNIALGANPAQASNDLWALSLGASPTWTPIAAAGTPPSPRLLHASFYDPSRSRMVTMGGTNAVAWYNDSWALALGGTPTWSNLAPSGTLPGVRSDHVFAYDPAGDRGVLFGGRAPDPFYNDVWTLNFAGSPNWTRVNTGPLVVPSVRLLHKAVYDPTRNLYITFGGTDAVTWLDDTWALSLDASLAWSPLGSPNGIRPPARSDHLLVRDSARDRLILFGGRDPHGFFGDVWAFDLPSQTWSQLSPPGKGPGAREAMVGMYDALRDRVLVFGGWDGSKSLNDVWSLEFTPSLQWRLIRPSGRDPAPRYAHALVYDAPRDRAIITGGFDGRTLFGDVWSLDLSRRPAWKQLQVSGPGPGTRYGEDVIFDSARNRMVLFGGYDGTFHNDAYALDLASAQPAWTHLNPGGSLPAPRDFSWSIYDPAKDRMVLFAGNALVTSNVTPEATQDLWLLTFADAAAGAPILFDNARTSPGEARLAWRAPGAEGGTVTAYRRVEGGVWQSLGAVVPDAAGVLVLADRVPEGGRFGYRLGVRLPGASETFTDDRLVTVPAGVSFGFSTALPNPVVGPLSIEFRLPAAGAASLDLLDVRGRRVVHRDVTGMGAGTHTVQLGTGRDLAPGVYFVELVQGSLSAQRKIAILR